MICICNELWETLFHFCVLYLRIRRKELKIRSYLCRLPSAVNVMLNLSNVILQFKKSSIEIVVAEVAVAFL